MHPAAGPVGERLGHEGADGPQLVGDFTGRHAKEDEPVRRSQSVREGEVDFELAVGVLVVDLINVDADFDEGGDEFFQKGPAAGETFVVVAGLVESVAGVGGAEFPIRAASEEHELRLEADVHHPAPFRQAGRLLKQHLPCVVGPRFPPDAAIADDAGVARLPRNEREGGDIADRHVVGVVRLLAQTPDGKAGKARSPFENVLEMAGGNRLGFGDAVDIDELSQHEFYLVLGEKDGCFFRGHRFASRSERPGKKTAVPTAPPPSSCATSSSVCQI